MLYKIINTLAGFVVLKKEIISFFKACFCRFYFENQAVFPGDVNNFVAQKTAGLLYLLNQVL